MRRISVVAISVLVLAIGVDSAEGDGVVPVEGAWKGETSAGLSVYFGVTGGRVVNTRFQFRWGFCGVFESHDKSANLEIDPGGHWVFEDPRGQIFEGTFVAPDRVEGKVISVERQLPGCPRTEATFTAMPVPPNPESMAAARAGIEALPYEIRLLEPRGVENVLIGKVHGSLGETFRFFLFVNRNAAARLRVPRPAQPNPQPWPRRRGAGEHRRDVLDRRPKGRNQSSGTRALHHPLRGRRNGLPPTDRQGLPGALVGSSETLSSALGVGSRRLPNRGYPTASCSADARSEDLPATASDIDPTLAW